MSPGALGYSIFAEADTWQALKDAVRDTVQCHFDEGERPDLIRLHAVHNEVVAA
ncbi:MAG: 2-oxoisovalerate dehydrogenase [Anaerolineae bacterium]